MTRAPNMSPRNAPRKDAAPTSLAAMHEVLRAEGGSRVVGWIGLDVPLELIEAPGFHPLQIVANPAHAPSAADPFAEGLGHPLLKALTGTVLELAESGLERILIGATPTLGFSLYSFLISLKRRGGTPPRLDPILVDIVRQDSDATDRFNLLALQRLGAVLSPHLCAPALTEIIWRRNRVRDGLNAIGTQRAQGRLSGLEALQVHAEAGSGLAHRIQHRLDQLVAELPDRVPRQGPRLVMSGGQDSAQTTYRVLEDAGFTVVADDHDAGSRAVGPAVSERGDPFAALAQRYRQRTPSPAGWSTRQSAAYLVDLVQRSGAHAVVFDIPAYDHPAAWDYPARRAALDAIGVPHVLLDPHSYRDPEAAALYAVEALQGLLADNGDRL